MLREGAEGLEALSAERLLVLVLEDLHWSDPATLALLALLAQRRGPPHLLLLGTYRPEAEGAQ
jgi:predicted ATPase